MWTPDIILWYGKINKMTQECFIAFIKIVNGWKEINTVNQQENATMEDEKLYCYK